jgi:lysophospholipase L1-like esterase
MRWSGSWMVAALVLLAPPAAAQSWTRAWTASMWPAADDQAPVLENVTIRSAIRVGAGGKQLRLRLANDYGVTIALGGASVRLRGANQALPVTFDGMTAPKLHAGAPLVSDPIALPVKAFDIIEVSLYLPMRTVTATVHEAAGEPTRISPPGDHLMADFTPASTSRFRPLIAGIDVQTARPRPVIVAYGDSITDVGSCPHDAVPICRWGDVLARRLHAAGKPHVVVNQAISGNRVISGGTSPSALARYDRDVLAMPGVTHVVLLEGVNDAGNSGLERNGTVRPVITAEELIAGYRQLITRAHERGIKVIGMTITQFEGAFYYSPEREAIRVKANEWIRNSGMFDAVIDIEKVVADPANPKKLAANLQGGDNLHPDGRGETAMGEAIPLGLFR